MARYPGASWRPIARYQPGGKSFRPDFNPRRLVLHTAVSNATPSMFSFFNVDGRATPHFYVGRDGEVEQYIDTDHGSSAVLDGSPTCITVETWDGYGHTWAGGAPGPRWRDKQVESLARLAVWCHAEHGIPLKQLPSSKPGTEGVGWHRQGIDGNFPPGLLAGRVNGGERWSLAQGKVCPTDTRIRQGVDQVIPRALAIAYPPVAFGGICANFDFVNERWQDFEDGHLIERVRPRFVFGVELKDRRFGKLLPSYDVHQAPASDPARANSAVAWDPDHVTVHDKGYTLLSEPDGEEQLTRHIAWADVETEGVVHKIGAVHMPKREFQDTLWRPAMQAVRAFIEESEYPVVLGGDWNRLVTGDRINLPGGYVMHGYGIDGFAVPADYALLKMRPLTDTESDHDFVYARFQTPGGTR